eukprot:scaffold3919_cov78-Skeletonema_dohrnii-CCMP3373.AAC.1
MVSKKKKKGRGKAKKTATKAEQKQEAATQQGTTDLKLERLKIEDNSKDEDALLDEAIKLAAAENEDRIRFFFAKKKHSNSCYHRIYISWRSKLGVEHASCSCCHEEQYPKLWDDSSKLKLVTSFYLFNATQHILEGNIEGAQLFAAIACFFQEYIAICVDKQKAMINSSKVLELVQADLHTLVKYLKKNIPCNCLDKKYEEVKSITKMGVCRNDNCSLPNRMVERSKMLCCTRCRDANYCSRECQKAAWSFHKKLCEKTDRSESRERP